MRVALVEVLVRVLFGKVGGRVLQRALVGEAVLVPVEGLVESLAEVAGGGAEVLRVAGTFEVLDLDR